MPEEAKKTENYANIINEIEHLSASIQDFLEWSSFENAPKEALESDALKILPMTKQIIELLPMNDQCRIKLKGTDSFYVFAKSTLLRQVLTNLITNSLKYANGEITIILGEHSWCISDLGPGIPDVVLSRVGQPFNRHANTSTKGSGLGLAWVKMVCNKYDWQLSIETSKDGTKVYITFPQESFSD